LLGLWRLWRLWRRRGVQPRARTAWPGWRIALLGVYGIWGYHTLLVAALHMAPQIEANILNYAWPLWIVLLGALLPGHRLTWRMGAAGLLGFAGVAVVIAGGRLPGGEGGQAALAQALPGLAVALAAGVVWASFTILLRRFVPAGEAHMPLFCLLAVVPAGLVVLARGAPLAVEPAQLPLLLYFGAVPLGLSFLLWERAVQGCNVQVLGVMSFFTPVLSTLLLALVSGAAVGAPALGGLALILAASALAWRGG
jgi:drug/metabolite transporter (DMT)-like permease